MGPGTKQEAPLLSLQQLQSLWLVRTKPLPRVLLPSITNSTLFIGPQISLLESITQSHWISRMSTQLIRFEFTPEVIIWNLTNCIVVVLSRQISSCRGVLSEFLSFLSLTSHPTLLSLFAVNLVTSISWLALISLDALQVHHLWLSRLTCLDVQCPMELLHIIIH